MTEKEACDFFSLPYGTDMEILQLLTTLCDIGFDVEEALQYLNCGEDTADGEAGKRELMLVKRSIEELFQICMDRKTILNHFCDANPFSIIGIKLNKCLRPHLFPMNGFCHNILNSFVLYTNKTTNSL